MTYVQIVNAVLTRLREDTVTTFNDEYVSLVADKVNDAKQLVEEAHNWQALRATEAVSTVASTTTYSLTGWGQRVAIEQVHDQTNSAVLKPTTVRYIREQQLYANPSEQAPTNWCIDGVDSNGDAQIRFYPTPDAVYTINVYGWKKQADLSATTDILLVPSKPVIHLALAMCAQERGEVGGQTAGELLAIAQRTLADAIAWDVSLDPTATDWYWH